MKKTKTEREIEHAVKLLERHGYKVEPPLEPVVVDVTEVNRRKMEPRRIAFIEELRKYLGTYSGDMLNAFYAYWTEPDRSMKKMRFELQKTWDLKLRLSNWYRRNNNQYGRKQITDTERADKLADILAG